MGGLPPLGYDGINRQLVINPEEAHTVRLIFRRYLEAGSIAELKRSLDREGIVSKRRVFSDGRTFGGVPISRGALYQILRNRLYIGEIVHRSEVHKGNHLPIIDQDLWDAVQHQLAEHSQRQRVETRFGGGSTGRGNAAPQRGWPEAQAAIGSGEVGARASGEAKARTPSGGANRSSLPPSSSPLTGLLFDEAGHRLTPTHALKNGKRYRYYVSAPLTRGEKIRDGIRVPAPDLEGLVVRTIVGHLRDAAWAADTFEGAVSPQDMQGLIGEAEALGQSLNGRCGDRDIADGRSAFPEQALAQCCSLIRRIIVAKGRVTLTVDRGRLAEALGFPDLVADEGDEYEGSDPPQVDALAISIPANFIRVGKQVRLVLGEVITEDRSPDPDLIRLVTDAHRWFEDLRSGRVETILDIANRDHQHNSEVSRTLPLAFLAPDIVEMILAGRQPPTLTMDRLKRRQSLPLLWSEQRDILLS